MSTHVEKLNSVLLLADFRIIVLTRFSFLLGWEKPKKERKTKTKQCEFYQGFFKKNGPKSPYFKEEKTLKSTYLNIKFQHVAETKLNPVKF